MITELKKIITKEIRKHNRKLDKKTIKRYKYSFEKVKIFDKLSY